MLTAQGCADRRERLRAAAPDGCDFLLVGSPEHLIYLADFAPSPFVFRAAEWGALLLVEPARATLIADDMLGPFARAAHVDERFTPAWYDGDHTAPERRGLLVRSALERLAGVPGRRVGVELASVPSGVIEGLRAARPGLELADITPLFRPLRRAKDADEVAALNRSMRAGEAAHAAALADVKPGMTELDVYDLVADAANTAAGARTLVYGDFASGPRTSTERGGPPTARRIEAGDLLLLDFSVVIDGYRGDFTNTFVVAGKPTADQRALFDACAAALEAGEARLRPGTPAREVDAAVRAAFAARGRESAFPHHSGHGVGLGHPEPPYLVRHSADTVEAGDVVTLEPGLYVEGIGGMRFERNYLITADGFERLSHHQIRIEAP
jgi:Xaa-Pro aminopeptidase